MIKLGLYVYSIICKIFQSERFILVKHVYLPTLQNQLYNICQNQSIFPTFVICFYNHLCLVFSFLPHTLPEAPWPICSILVYFLLGSPTVTMVRSFDKISSSVIFFFFGLSFKNKQDDKK